MLIQLQFGTNGLDSSFICNYFSTLQNLKMRKIAALLAFLPLFGLAQDKGIHFQHGLSWTEIQAKAKAENKYIFMDCFTTWCGPCKYMSSTIFPQESVGSYMNDKFISVKVQLDTSKNDNEDVKKWYADGHEIMQKYSVRAFPTFLFFAPDGSIVHRMVGAGEAKEFLERASAAVDPAKQYYPLIEKYNKGERNPDFLRKAAMAASDAYDAPTAKKISAEYLQTQKDLLTKENIEFLDKFTNTSKDKGFEVFMKNPAKVNAVLGAGKAEQKVRTIAFNEDVVPKIYDNETRQFIENVDWVALEKNLTAKYPSLGGELASFGKVTYYKYKKDWKNFQAAIIPYMEKYSAKASDNDLNEYAWAIFENCNDVACLQQALEWSKKSFQKDNNAGFMDTYANLLYKMGKKDDAIAWETKAMNASPEGERKNYQETLEKMNKGEKTWKD